MWVCLVIIYSYLYSWFHPNKKLFVGFGTWCANHSNRSRLSIILTNHDLKWRDMDMLCANHKTFTSLQTLKMHLKKLTFSKSNIIIQSVICHGNCIFGFLILFVTFSLIFGNYFWFSFWLFFFWNCVFVSGILFRFLNFMIFFLFAFSIVIVFFELSDLLVWSAVQDHRIWHLWTAGQTWKWTAELNVH